MENVEIKKPSTENKNGLRVGEPDIELQKLINSIDLAFLHSIALEDLRHTDLYPNELNFLGSEKILGVKNLYLDGKEITAVYNAGVENLISISGKVISKIAVKAGVSERTVLVFIVCHEIAHSVVKNITGYMPSENGAYEVGTYYRYGYGKFQMDFGGKNQKNEFDIFEEGLTEKYGREIFLKFIENRPDFLPEGETKKLIDFYNQWGGQVAQYNSAMWFTDALIKKISLDTGFPEETVWHAILRDRLESRGFDDEGFQGLIAEFVSDNDFLDELKKAESVEDFQKLQDKLNRTKDPNFILRSKKRVEGSSMSFM